MASIKLNNYEIFSQSGDTAPKLNNSTGLNFSTTNQNFTIKGIDAPIVGTNYSTNDNPNSGQLAIYNGDTKLWGINESGWVQQPNVIWFYAWNGATQTSDTVETVQFTNVSQNASNSYNNTTYRFTAPVNGTYYFAYTMMAGADEYTRSSFYINGVKKNEVFVDNTTYSRSVNFIISFLAAGDYIEVKYNTNNSASESSIHSNYRSFVGYLLG